MLYREVCYGRPSSGSSSLAWGYLIFLSGGFFSARRFRAQKPGWTKGVNVEPYHGYWGGEVAANRLLHLLVPETAVIYARETPKQLIAGRKLRATSTEMLRFSTLFGTPQCPPPATWSPPIFGLR
jgi:hypothetical protein